MAECNAQKEYLENIEALQNEYDTAAVRWEIFHPGEPYTGERPEAVNRYVPAEMDDLAAINRFYSILNRGENINAEKDVMIERAKAFYGYYAGAGQTGTFAAQYQVRLANRYLREDRSAVTYPPEYGQGWDLYLTFGGDSILLLAAALLVGTMLLLPDRTGGFALILRTTKRGRAQTLLAKGAVGAVAALVLSAAFSLLTLGVFFVKYRMWGAGLPLQCYFSYAILHISAWQAALLRIGVRALGVYCVMLFALLLSVFCRHAGTVYGCGGAVLALFYALYHFQPFYEHSPFYLFNIFTVFQGGAYLKYWNAVSLFGRCVDYGVALPLLLAGTAAVLLGAGTLCFAHSRGGVGHTALPFARIRKQIRERFAKCRATRAGRAPRTHSLRVGAYEWRKLFSGVLPVLLCLVLVGFGVFSAVRELVLPENYQERMEREYIEALGSTFNEQTRGTIENWSRENAEILGAFPEKSAAYRAGTLGYEEFTAYVKAYNTAKNREETIKALSAKAAYLDRLEKEGVSADLVYDAGWLRLLSTMPDYLLAAFLLLMLAGIYTPEKRGGFALVLNSTKYGRLYTARAKLRAVLGLSAGCGALSALLRIFLVAGSAGLPSLRSPAAGIEAYRNFGGSLFSLLLVWFFCRVAGAVVVGLLCFSLSALFGKTVPVITLGALAVFTVPVLHIFGITALDNRTVDGLLGGTAPAISPVARGYAVGWCALAAVLLALALVAVGGKRQKGGRTCS